MVGIMKHLKKDTNNMEFTFGIITSGTEDKNINIIIDSIENQNKIGRAHV